MIDNYRKLLEIVEEIKEVLLKGQELSDKAKTVIERQERIIKINGENFCSQITTLRCQNMDEAEEGEANLKSKTDFHLTSESIEFSDVIESFNSLIDLFDSDLDDSESSSYGLSENGLRSAIQEIIIPKFSKYYDTN